MANNTYPAIRNAQSLVPVEIKLSELAHSGNTATYGISVGDVIKFPAKASDLVLFKQPVRKGDDAPLQYLVGVERNGAKSYISMGILSRIDATGQPTCSFIEDMRKMHNNEDRLKSLLGKSITCTEMTEKPFYTFNSAGERSEEPTMKNTPVISFVK